MRKEKSSFYIPYFQEFFIFLFYPTRIRICVKFCGFSFRGDLYDGQCEYLIEVVGPVEYVEEGKEKGK